MYGHDLLCPHALKERLNTSVSAEYVSHETCGHNKLCPYDGCIQFALNCQKQSHTIQKGLLKNPERRPIGLRKAVCCLPKGRLLAGKRRPFVMRWMSMCYEGWRKPVSRCRPFRGAGGSCRAVPRSFRARLSGARCRQAGCITVAAGCRRRPRE